MRSEECSEVGLRLRMAPVLRVLRPAAFSAESGTAMSEVSHDSADDRGRALKTVKTLKMWKM